MREILGYAPVQPDGSVQIQVPANVPFTIDVLDANARRITAQHTSWLQVHAGRDQVLQRLPHRTANDRPLARPRGPDGPVNPGAPDHRVSRSPTPIPRCSPNAGRDHGADPGAHQLRDRRAKLAERRAVLADPQHRRHLHADLDQRRDHCRPGRPTDISYPYGIDVDRRRHLGIPSRRRPTRNCAAVERAMPRSPSITRNADVEPASCSCRRCGTCRDPTSRPSTAWPTLVDVHHLPQHRSRWQSKIQVPAGQLDLTGGASSAWSRTVVDLL